MGNLKGCAEPEIIGAIQAAGPEESGRISVIESYGAKVLVHTAITLVAGESVRDLNVHGTNFFEWAANVLLIFRLQTIVSGATGRVLEVTNSYVRVNAGKRCAGID